MVRPAGWRSLLWQGAPAKLPTSPPKRTSRLVLLTTQTAACMHMAVAPGAADCRACGFKEKRGGVVYDVVHIRSGAVSGAPCSIVGGNNNVLQHVARCV